MEGKLWGDEAIADYGPVSLHKNTSGLAAILTHIQLDH